MSILQSHLFAIFTPMLAATSQVIIKWQVRKLDKLPEEGLQKILFLVEFLFRPWVLLAIFATFLSGVTWIMAMTKLELSYAYPYVALTFVVVPTLGIVLFGESITQGKILGGVFILLGIGIVMFRG